MELHYDILTIHIRVKTRMGPNFCFWISIIISYMITYRRSYFCVIYAFYMHIYDPNVTMKISDDGRSNDCQTVVCNSQLCVIRYVLPNSTSNLQSLTGLKVP